MDAMSPEFHYVTGQARASFPELFAQFEAANLRALAGRPWYLDIPYGEHVRQTFDFCPAREDPIGRVVYIHAGYWQSRDKSQFRFLAPALSDAGFDVAMVNYPLCPDVTLPELTTYVRDAIAAGSVAGPAAQRHLPLIVSGHSAGGHLTVELALAQQPDTPKHQRISGIVPISGIYDLAPLVETSLNEKLRLTRELALLCSPIKRVKASLPPAVFLVGGAETSEFLRQSSEMSTAWIKAGNVSSFVPVQAEDHFSILAKLGEPDGPLIAAIRKVTCL